MRIKKMILDNFKGVTHAEYSIDGDMVSFVGTNGVGKTTVATAYLWVLADKDYELNSNPDIRPDDDRECIPTVTIVADFNSKEVTICKMQKKKVGKPDVNGVSKVTLTNTYTINEVPKTERDFKSYLEDLGFVFDNFLPCTHTEVFTNQKQADMRKKLFEMTSMKSDLDIAKMSKETKDVAKLLSNYTYEEIEAMQKASKKKATEQCESIPDQIIGMEKSKVDIDVNALEVKKNDLTTKIDGIKEQIKSNSKVIDDLEQKKFELKFEISDCKRKANESLVKQKSDIEDKVYKSESEIRKINQDISILSNGISEKKSSVARLEAEKDELGSQYKEMLAKKFDGSLEFDESKWVFDESSTVCSLCEQILPEDKISEIKAEFESKKANAKAKAEQMFKDAKKNFENEKKTSLAYISEQGNKKKTQIEELSKEIAEFESKLPELEKQKAEVEEQIKKYKSEFDNLPNEVDLSTNEDYLALMKKDEDLATQIAKTKADGVDTSSLEDEVSRYEDELERVKAEIAQASNNTRIDEKICEMQKQKLDYEQAKADAERILNQLSIVSKKKNEVLVNEINSHFSLVKWMLFDYQKNGEYKEVCVPLIDEKKFGKTTNTGLEIIARLDICNSFQKFYKMQIPIFLDHASIIDKKLLPKIDAQLFLLVNDASQKKLKVEVE